jgi:hypothetical protein
LLLQVDLRRWLPATDADGRDLVVSCGAVLHHTRIALAASGVHAVVHRIPDPARPDDLAAQADRQHPLQRNGLTRTPVSSPG